MWNPFSKQSYAKQKLLSPQEAQEFDRQRSEIGYLEKTFKKLSQDVKEYGSASQALNKCEARIPQSLLASGVASGSALQKVGDSWQKAVGDINKIRTDDLQEFNQVLSEPAKKYLTAIAGWNSAMKKWEHHAQECAKENAKAEKFKEKEQTPSNRSKYEQHQKAHEYAKEEFFQWHNQLTADGAQFLNGRGQFFSPSLDALVEVQMGQCQQLQRLYSSLCLEVQADWAGSDQAYKTLMQNKLQELKALTIVASDR